EAGLAPEKIERFWISSGPGSFTALRVAYSVVKMLAFSGGRPVTATSTLELIARRGIGERALATEGEWSLVALRSAGRDERYAAPLQWRAGILTRLPAGRLCGARDLTGSKSPAFSSSDALRGEYVSPDSPELEEKLQLPVTVVKLRARDL